MKNPKPTTVIYRIQCPNNIIHIHSAKSRHMIDELVEALKSINNTMYNYNLAINNLNYARNFLIISLK